MQSLTKYHLDSTAEFLIIHTYYPQFSSFANPSVIFSCCLFCICICIRICILFLKGSCKR